jgi:D-sedoheptulose 7-phosphate isomerase
VPVDGNIVEYFEHLGELGGKTEATNRAGDAIALDDAVASAVSLSLAAKGTGSRVLFVGNGGSAAIASHMATDWLKNGGYAATCFNDGSTLTCLGNDLGYDQVFALQIERHSRAGDLLFAISSSGKSQNILNAVIAARRVGANVITLTGFSPDNPLRRMGNLNFWLPDYHYGFAEIGHLAICHAILDMSMGWRRVGDLPVAAAAAVSG